MNGDELDLTCRLWVGPEDRCGDPAVAIDRGSDEARCADHVDEELWRIGGGWIPMPKGPLAWASVAA